MSRWTAIRRACLFPLTIVLGLPAANAAIGVDPDCPAPTDIVTIVANGPTVQREPLSVTVTGNTVKLVAQAYNSGFSLPPYTEVRGVLPPLVVGKYRVEFYTRIQPNGAPDGDPATLLPERLQEAATFEVFANPPVCAPAMVEVIGASFTSADADDSFPEAVRFRVTDSHGNPNPNIALRVERVRAPSEPSTNAAVPDLAQPLTSITTGIDGVASLGGRANRTAGSFQYRAFVYSPIGYRRAAYATFYNRPAGSARPGYPVIEFRRYTPQENEHFIMTGDSAEAAALDRSRDWSRTGEVFMTFAPGSNHAGTSPVCRYYGLPSAGLDSHFFSAAPEECAAVAQRYASAWKLETSDAFEVYLPDRATGECPPATRKVHRAYNNLPDANHRYAFTPYVAVSNLHPYDGPYWTLEGYGPDSVVMCLPQ